MISKVKYGKIRDKKIITALEDYQCLDTFQLAILFFPSCKMARKRMLVLYKNKKVKRVRFSIDEPNAFYLEKADEEIIKLNWIRIYLEKKCAYGDTPIHFDYEKLILTYENPLTKIKRQTVIQMGKKKLDFSGNTFFVDDSKAEQIKEGLLCGRL